ncbi:MAG: flavodoxin family protein [Proteobacteria bacterium]|nr:flavodoxin family protein [Pseudomonadota bacterium]
MKVLGLDASPREGGNTEKLVRQILAGAEEEGAQTAFYKLSRMSLSPCMGCNEQCRDTGVCEIADDMEGLYGEIREAGAVVLGSPVYMGQMTPQAKAFLDRLVPFLRPDFSMRFAAPKKLFFAFTQGNPDPEAFRVYFDYTEQFLSRMFDMQKTLVIPGTRAPDDILGLEGFPENAREAGRGLAR